MSNQVKLVKTIACTITAILSMSVMGCAPKRMSPPLFKEYYNEITEKKNSDNEAKDNRKDTNAEGTTSLRPAAAVRMYEVPKFDKRGPVVIKPPQIDQVPELKHQPEQAKPAEINVQLPTGNVQLSIENMPIYEFINMVFGEVLKLNYTVSPELQNAPDKINLNMGQKLTAKDFMAVVLDLLSRNNVDIRQSSGILIASKKAASMPESQASSQNLEIYIGNKVPDGAPFRKIYQLVTTSNIAIGNMMTIIKQLQAGNDIRFEILPYSQALLLYGTADSIARVTNLMEQLDRPYFYLREFRLLYLDYINVSDFDKKIREILPPLGIPVSKSPNDSGVFTITFDKINAVLFIYEKKEWLDAILYWKDKLDTPESMGDETQLFVFKPKNRPAFELVEVLSSILGKVTSTAGSSDKVNQSRTPQAAPAPTPVSVRSDALATGLPGGIPGRNFSVFLDKGRNAVIISANASNFKLIKNILIQLDTQPKQVLIEATIAEITLQDQLQYGIEWFIQHSIKNNNTGNFSGTVSTLGGLALGGSGLNYAITKLSGDFKANVNAFAKDSMINIISTPHIVVLDGKEAVITVGTEVPVITAETSANDISSSSSQPSILRNVQYRNTGVILRVKPTVNSEGLLTVDISQELSEAQNNSVSNIDSPLILNRSVTTSLILKTGETVMLGGLIRENKSKTKFKVPILGDIPLIGNLFKTTSDSVDKTELILEITTYILNDTEQLDFITKKFKDIIFQN